jgi:hypothetical protein
MRTLKLSLILLALFLFGNYELVLADEPAWLSGKPMNQWFEINGTSGAGGAVLSWGPLILREDTTELFVAASGGHSDSSDNRVVSIKLTDDNPQWILRAASTPADQVVLNAPYYMDGKPASRHGYQHNFWVPAINRIILCGARAVAGAAWDFPTIDGFNPDTNTWDPQNTWPNVTGGYGVVRERNGSIMWTTGLARVDLEARELTQPITSRIDVAVRWPVAHDSLRHQLFTLQYGDGQGYDLQKGVQASRIPINGDRQFTVTFKSSTALDTFISDAPTYSAMDYDPINDRFLFYCGQGAGAGRIFVITPNDGDEWDMSILPLEGSALPPAAPGSGVNRRFLYVPGLNVFVMMPSGADNIHFIRVGSFEQIPQSAPVAINPSSSAPQASNAPSTSPNTPKGLSSELSQVTYFTALLLILSVVLML